MFVGFGVDGVVEGVEVVLLAPFFRVAELLVCIVDDPAARAEEAPGAVGWPLVIRSVLQSTKRYIRILGYTQQSLVVVGRRRPGTIQRLFLEKDLEVAQRLLLGLGQMSQVAIGVPNVMAAGTDGRAGCRLDLCRRLQMRCGFARHGGLQGVAGVLLAMRGRRNGERQAPEILSSIGASWSCNSVDGESDSKTCSARVRKGGKTSRVKTELQDPRVPWYCEVRPACPEPISTGATGIPTSRCDGGCSGSGQASPSQGRSRQPILPFGWPTARLASTPAPTESQGTPDTDDGFNDVKKEKESHHYHRNNTLH